MNICSSHPYYRRDIDGLRAIAVLSVIGFHAFPSWFPGGFVGVDIFFVISGYLISNIIIRELETDCFSISRFYSRRIKRIFPALLAMLLFCYIAGLFCLLPDELKSLSRSISYGSGFLSNFLLIKDHGYFALDSNLNPLLHLWSLGIEEQFYIAWPIILLISHRFKVPFIYICVGALFVSFLLNVAEIRSHSVATFYSPQTRVWELAGGAVIAAAKRGDLPGTYLRALTTEIHNLTGRIGRHLLINSASLIGAGLIFCGFFLLDEGLPFPGWWAVIPVLGTTLLVASGPEAWVNRRILSERPLVGVGLISYPLYLWHWPLLSFARVVEGSLTSPLERISAVVIAVMLSAMTFRYIERPIRSRPRKNGTTAALASCMIAVGALGYVTHKNDDLKLQDDRLIKISNAANEWDFLWKNMSPFPYEGRRFYRQSTAQSNTTLFIGDSNAEQYYSRVLYILQRYGEKMNSVIFATEGGCLPIPGSPYDAGHRTCAGLTEAAKKLAAENPRITNIVIAAQWNGYFGSGLALTGEFGAGSALYETSLAALKTYILDLKALGKTVYLILNIPTGAEFDPKSTVQRSLRTFPTVFTFLDQKDVKRSVLSAKYGWIQKDLEKVAIESGAVVIDPLDYICSDSVCPVVDADGMPLYKDRVHLSARYAREHARFIDRTLIISDQ